ncbi:hypothetical protein EV178_006274 [Coemansia sp. RSA 1646]|nr:hypothetical protein EV178_006274 [Coemansia sp. RSA 1646]KAJ2210435.1 hypothetical protein EV179_006244 [Coemansia sp. RSA 487]
MAEKDRPATKSNGIFRDVVDSIFEPGVNRGVIVVMNCAFIALFFILTYLLIATNFNIHVCALSALSTLLFASINWFIKEATATASKAAEASKASDAKSSKSRPRSASKKKKL